MQIIPIRAPMKSLLAVIRAQVDTTIGRWPARSTSRSKAGDGSARSAVANAESAPSTISPDITDHEGAPRAPTVDANFLWSGIFAPRRRRPRIARKLEAAFIKIARPIPTWTARLQSPLGVEVVGSSTEEFSARFWSADLGPLGRLSTKSATSGVEQ